MTADITKTSEKIMLEILKVALTDAEPAWERYLNEQAYNNAQLWHKVFEEAERHLLLPVVCKCICDQEFISRLDADVREEFEEAKKRAAKEVVSQYKRTAAFLDLYVYLCQQGIKPLVVKGLVCRNVYPFPEYRQSWDEDILVAPEEYEACHNALVKYGMYMETTEKEARTAYEIIYKDFSSRMLLEVHKTLFSSDSKVFDAWNQYFSDAFLQSRSVDINDAGEIVSVWTLSPQQHLLFLICHTFKHFLYFGAGLRQLTDILMFSKRYGKEIDWDLLRKECIGIRADRFVADIFAIGEKYLGFDAEAAMVPGVWRSQAVDTEKLLRDVLDAGMQANTDMSRIHSSNITLNAMKTEVSGGKNRSVLGLIVSSVFPPYSYLRHNYPYLEKYPFLLPAAWAQRITRYGIEAGIARNGNNAAESIRIGNDRVTLMQGLDIVDRSETGSARKRKRIESKDPGDLSGKIKKAGNSLFGGKAVPIASLLWKAGFSMEWTYLDLLWKVQGSRLPGNNEQKAVKSQVTFIYKSFERQWMAIELYKNIQRYYPGAQVIIADDSSTPLKYDDSYLKIIQLPFNSGLSYGLSKALEQVNTPYVVRMDDDELLTRHTNLGKQLLFLHRHPEVDLVTFGFITVANHHPEKAVWPDYYKQPMDEAPKKLLIRHMTQIDKTHVVLGKGPNIYLARTASLRKVGYDQNVRMIDHHDFFLRAAGEIVTTGALDSFVFHRHDPFDRDYQKYRRDINADREYLRKKYS